MGSWTENKIKIPSRKIRLESDDVAVLPINRNRENMRRLLATLTVTINVVLEYGVYDKRTYDIQNLFSDKTVDILVNEENSFHICIQVF